MPGVITGTAGVSPVRLLHPDPGAARGDERLLAAGWVETGRDVVGPESVFAVELESVRPDGPDTLVRGVVAAWEVADPPQAGGLLPHEQTDAKAVRRRVQALASAHVDRDPLLLTHRGGGRITDLLRDRGTPVYEVAEGSRHVRVSQIDAEVGRRVLAELRGGHYLVADGHHRLAGALGYLRDGFPATVTALVIDADDTPLSLGPIHRVLLDEKGRERLDEQVCASVLQRCRSAGADVISLQGDGDTVATAGSVELVHLDRSWSVRWPHHPVTDLTTLVEHVLDDTGATRTRREPDADLARAAARHGALTVLLPAPDFDDVLALAERGVLLPYKATAFQPKLPAGTLVRPLPGWTPTVLAGS